MIAPIGGYTLLNQKEENLAAKLFLNKKANSTDGYPKVNIEVRI
jgi:hypothetical protein